MVLLSEDITGYDSLYSVSVNLVITLSFNDKLYMSNWLAKYWSLSSKSIFVLSALSDININLFPLGYQETWSSEYQSLVTEVSSLDFMSNKYMSLDFPLLPINAILSPLGDHEGLKIPSIFSSLIFYSF